VRVDTDQHHGSSLGNQKGTAAAGTPDANRCLPLASHATA
jgi:hypothetical protein